MPNIVTNIHLQQQHLLSSSSELIWKLHHGNKEVKHLLASILPLSKTTFQNLNISQQSIVH